MFKYLPLLAVLSFCVFSCLDNIEDVKLTPHPYAIGYDTPYIDTLMITNYEDTTYYLNNGDYFFSRCKYTIAYKKNKETFDRIKDIYGFDDDRTHLMLELMRVRHLSSGKIDTVVTNSNPYVIENLSDAFDDLPSLDGEWHYDGWGRLLPGTEYCYQFFFRSFRDLGPNEDSYKRIELCHVFEH